MMNTRSIQILLILTATALLTGGCGTGAFQIEMVPRNPKLTETRLHREKGAFISDKILVIDVDGVIANSAQGGFMQAGQNPTAAFLEKLDKAANDDSIKAVIVRLNTPGGSVSATDIMYHALLEYKRKTGNPVIAFMLDIAASGGYYLACGCDGIIAMPTTVTGSIGTIMQTVSVEGTMEKIGVKAVAVKSGKMKDIASPLHDLRDDEKAVLQGVIDHLYEMFLDIVEQGRPGIGRDKLRKLADGRIYTAQQAKEANLVDRIGYAEDAVQWAKEVAGVEKAHTVIYHLASQKKPNIYAPTMQTGGIEPLVNIDLPDWLDGSSAKFLYLWQPGL